MWYAWILVSLAAPALPPELAPWADWVLHDKPEVACPVLEGVRTCAWPGRLDFAATADGASFTLQARVDAPGRLALPGADDRWPIEVRVDGRPAPVLPDAGAPTLWLEPGDHRITGRFAWASAPRSLPIPKTVAVVGLRVNGEAVPFPKIDEGGALWLGQGGGSGDEAEAVQIDVSRKIDDGVPVVAHTTIDLRVSGSARELDLGAVALAGSRPVALDADVPARFSPDGHLILQLRPGTLSVSFDAVFAGPVAEIAAPKLAAPWPETEYWAFEADDRVRAVNLLGPPGVDPSRTSLPESWRSLRTFAVDPSVPLRFEELRRGEAEPPPNQLTLQRTLWLDADGRGFTVHDELSGAMNRDWRLDLLAPGALGRAALAQEGQVVTTIPGVDGAGLEVRSGALALDADGRVEASGATLPAVGWNVDVRQLGVNLNLPPGWSLLHAGGVDNQDTALLARWTLLDLFFVALSAIATSRLLGPAWGAVALAALATAIHDYDAPGWSPVILVATLGLAGAAPTLRAWLVGLGWAIWLWLAMWAAPWVIEEVRVGLYPVLDDPAPVYDERTILQATSMSRGGMDAASPAEPAYEKAMDAPPAGGEAEEGDLGGRKEDGKASYSRLKKALSSQKDAAAVVQTGPGLPNWRWASHPLSWTGPVGREHQITLWLLGPWATMSLTFAKVGLMVALALRLARGLVALRAAPPPSGGSAPGEGDSPSGGSGSGSPGSGSASGGSGSASGGSVSGPPEAGSASVGSVSGSLGAGSASGGSGLASGGSVLASRVPGSASVGSVSASVGSVLSSREPVSASAGSVLASRVPGSASVGSVLAAPESGSASVGSDSASGGSVSTRAASAFGSAAAAILAALLLAVPTPAHATPTPELLTELQRRLTADPPCGSDCLAPGAATVRIDGSRLVFEAEIHAGRAIAAPMPTATGGPWSPSAVFVDGRPADAVRGPGGAVWVRLTPGVHTARIEAPIATNGLTLQFGLRPAHLRVDAPGWRVEGVSPDGRPEPAIMLLREQARDQEADADSDELPAWLEVRRSLDLGIPWRVRTTVVRLGAADRAATVKVPLLPGESVTDAAVQVRDGAAVATLPPGAQELEWLSDLAIADTIPLTATGAEAFAEEWQVSCSPVFSCRFEGIAPLRHVQDGTWAPVWRPFSGEAVTVFVTRPSASAGQTVTVDEARLQLRPGTRELEASLDLSVRTSQGGTRTLKLPEGSRLQSVSADGTVLPVQLRDGRDLQLPLRPGAQRFAISWTQPTPIGARAELPVVDLGGPAVNVTVDVDAPQSRWVFAVQGPAWGPVVLFWGWVAVILLAAPLLARIPNTGVGTVTWAILGLGLTQTDPLVIFVIAGWFALIGVRRATPPSNPYLFALLQLMIPGATLLFLTVLYWAIHAGLLYEPEMGIRGNNSYANHLSWYADRVDATSPSIVIWTAPMWTWRVLNLAWALWTATSLTRWLPAAWQAFSAGGLWRELPRRAVKAPTPAPATVAPTPRVEVGEGGTPPAEPR
jgi:hypothetical protein